MLINEINRTVTFTKEEYLAIFYFTMLGTYVFGLKDPPSKIFEVEERAKCLLHSLFLPAMCAIDMSLIDEETAPRNYLEVLTHFQEQMLNVGDLLKITNLAMDILNEISDRH